MKRRTYGFEPACCAACRAFSALVLAINNSLVRLAPSAEHIPGDVGRRPAICLQRASQGVVDRLAVDELETLALVLGDLVHVGLVAGRNEHALDARPLRRERLLLQAAD